MPAIRTVGVSAIVLVATLYAATNLYFLFDGLTKPMKPCTGTAKIMSEEPRCFSYEP